MILKIGELGKPELTKDEVAYEKAGWRFIDKIDNLSLTRTVEKDPNGKDYNLLRINILKDDNTEYIVQITNEPVYLLSDEGKTIERIN